MKVILVKDFKGTGKKGDVIETSMGYARNFLFPKKIAVEATSSNMNKLNLQKKSEEKKQLQMLDLAKQVCEKLENQVIKINVKSGDNGKIFGSVTNSDIAKHLKNKMNVDIDKRKISIDDSIRYVGNYKVKVKLHPEVVCNLNIEVI